MKYLLGCVLLGISSMAGADQRIRFASDRASVPLPSSFQVKVSGDELLATFGARKDHRLELSLLASFDAKGGTRDLALLFVEEQGKKKGAKVHTDGARAVFSEAGSQSAQGDTVFQAMHWQIGVGNCVFSMTLSAPLPMSKELDEFLGDPLNSIVNELTCS